MEWHSLDFSITAWFFEYVISKGVSEPAFLSAGE